MCLLAAAATAPTQVKPEDPFRFLHDRLQASRSSTAPTVIPATPPPLRRYVMPTPTPEDFTVQFAATLHGNSSALVLESAGAQELVLPLNTDFEHDVFEVSISRCGPLMVVLWCRVLGAEWMLLARSGFPRLRPGFRTRKKTVKCFNAPSLREKEFDARNTKSCETEMDSWVWWLCCRAANIPVFVPSSSAFCKRVS